MEPNPSTAAGFTALANQLTRQEAWELSPDDLKGILHSLLRHASTWPHGGLTTSKDKSVIDAIRFLDDGITFHENTNSWESRVAYIRLAKLFKWLEPYIEEDRKNGLFKHTRGSKVQGDITTLYWEATMGKHSTRKEVEKRKRIANRWALLIGDSILLAASYSEKADRIVCDFSVKLATLQKLGNHVRGVFAESLVPASQDLDNLLCLITKFHMNDNQIEEGFAEFAGACSRRTAK